MIPEHDPRTGALPPGDHQATWKEVTERYGFGVRRRKILRGLELVLMFLHDEVDVAEVYLNGSFTTDKERPGDVDVVVFARGEIPERWQDRAKHEERKKKWLVDLYFSSDIKSFMSTTRSGQPKGFIQLFEGDLDEGDVDDQE